MAAVAAAVAVTAAAAGSDGRKKEQIPGTGDPTSFILRNNTVHSIVNCFVS